MNWHNLALECLRSIAGCEVVSFHGGDGYADHVLVVPAYNERFASLKRLLDSIDDAGVRVIIVVNESVAASSEAITQNAALVDDLVRYRREYGALLTVAHITQPKDRGVGGARYAGCRIARMLQREGLVTSDLLHNTDADSMLPSHCFRVTEATRKDDTALMLYSLGHQREWAVPAELEAASMVRAMLTLCMLALSSMRSPWAFPNTGCGVTIPAWAYDQIGGWPQVSVAEDIYFEGNLAKLGRVQRAPHLRVLTSTRAVSKALPFPGVNDEGAGHGAMIAAVSRGMAGNGFEMVATAPEGWDVLRLVYNLIWGYLEGEYSGDQRQWIEAAKEKLALPWIDTKRVDEMICEKIGSLGMMVGPPGPDRALRFFSLFDQELQKRLIDDICLYVDRCDVVRCVNGSPWGVKYEGSWLKVADELAALEETLCTADVGLGSLVVEETP